jgi:hypothetical protein
MPVPYTYIIPKERVSYRLLGSLLITIVGLFFGLFIDPEFKQYIHTPIGWAILFTALALVILISWWVKVGRRDTTVLFDELGIHITGRGQRTIPWSKMSAWMSTDDLQQSVPFSFIYAISKPMGPRREPTTVELLQANVNVKNLANSTLRTLPVLPEKYIEITKALSTYIPRQVKQPQPTFPDLSLSSIRKDPNLKRGIIISFCVAIGIVALVAILSS